MKGLRFQISVHTAKSCSNQKPKKETLCMGLRALLREKSAGRYLYLSNNNKVVQTGFLSAKCRYWQPCLPRWALGLEAKNSQLCFAEFFCQSVSAEQFSWLSFFLPNQSKSTLSLRCACAAIWRKKMCWFKVDFTEDWLFFFVNCGQDR